MYCSDCGTELDEAAQFCGDCGTAVGGEAVQEDSGGLSARQYLWIGIASALLSIVLVPVVFGPLALFCSYKVYQSDEATGLVLAVGAGICFVVGMILGAMAMASVAVLALV